MQDRFTQPSTGSSACRRDGGTIPISGGRRGFISTIASAGIGALACSGLGRLTSIFEPTLLLAKGSLIDVRHHFVPPFYFSNNRERIAAAGGGRMHPAYASWTAEQALAAMDKEGVATAVLSLTTPGVWFGDAQTAAQTARRVNEYGADLVRNHRGRFGLFAVIPLPHTESSVREIDYAFSVLKADGIGLMTSYDDKWLGDPPYEPVFEELNRRKAVVFVHPTTGLCCRTLLPDINPIMLEIPQDTTRAVANLSSDSPDQTPRRLFRGSRRTVPAVAARTGGGFPVAHRRHARRRCHAGSPMSRGGTLIGPSLAHARRPQSLRAFFEAKQHPARHDES